MAGRVVDWLGEARGQITRQPKDRHLGKRISCSDGVATVGLGERQISLSSAFHSGKHHRQGKHPLALRDDFLLSCITADTHASLWTMHAMMHLCCIAMQVSGDSVPVKPASFYCTRLSSTSVVGWWPVKTSDERHKSEWGVVYEHSQWKMLVKVDVQHIVSTLLATKHAQSKQAFSDLFYSYIEEDTYNRDLHCHRQPNPDEWIIGTHLVRTSTNWGESSLRCIGDDIMECECDVFDKRRPCPHCHDPIVGHARSFAQATRHFTGLWKRAVHDPFTLALRKVSKLMPADEVSYAKVVAEAATHVT
jgi:hypothetical protein